MAALWEYQERHGGSLPSDAQKAAEIEAIAADLVTRAEVNRQALPNVPKELAEYATLQSRFALLTKMYFRFLSFTGTSQSRPCTNYLPCVRLLVACLHRIS